MKRFFSCLAVCLCGVALPVSAQVYRCVTDGAVTISTQPCPAGAAATEYKPEPGAAEREAAAKKAADEDLARMKERVMLMERERRERDAALDAAHREQEIRSQEYQPSIEPTQEEGLVERTVIWGGPLYPYHPPHYNPGKPPRPRPGPPRPNPTNGGNKKSSGNESTGVFRPGLGAASPEPEKKGASSAPRTSPGAAGRAASSGATGKTAPGNRAGKP
ncbi:MAG: DUF4124 domain-containing protein [Betaproteobacteria bacterium]|nr:DUF4124 domain-containing protein [Betaproteobacteria bacterium]